MFCYRLFNKNKCYDIMDELRALLSGSSASSDNIVIDSVVNKGYEIFRAALSLVVIAFLFPNLCGPLTPVILRPLSL